MGRLPVGEPTAHMSATQGPDANLMKFYSTSYATSFGAKHEPFVPRTTKHVGTGYQSNFRPGVYYSQRLDEVDNPAMGRIVSDNYNSITTKHFKPSIRSDGKDRFPETLNQVKSGFTEQNPINFPTVGQVRKVFVNTRDHGLGLKINGVLPKHRPLLYKLQAKDPVSLENAGHGPNFMSTEAKTRFSGRPSERKDCSTLTVGPKEGSGYTHAYNVEPISFHPGSPFKNTTPGTWTNRPTGNSIMKTDFLPSQQPSGDERLPTITNRSDHETGFTHEKAKPLYVHRVMTDAYTKRDQVPGRVEDRIRKEDPAEYLNMTNPDNHSSIFKKSYEGQQRPSPSANELQGRLFVGNKEMSGYSDNNDKPQAQIPVEPYRWISHYDTKFYDMNTKGRARAGRTFGAVMKHLPDGYTKSTSVHSYGPALDTTHELRSLHPYVARSIKARDVFYDDHTHDAKKHVTINPIPQFLAASC